MLPCDTVDSTRAGMYFQDHCMQAGCNDMLVVLLCRGFKVCKQDSKCLHLAFSENKTFVVPKKGLQEDIDAGTVQKEKTALA